MYSHKLNDFSVMNHFQNLPSCVKTLIYEFDGTFKHDYRRAIVNTFKYNLQNVVLRKTNIPSYIPHHMKSHFYENTLIHFTYRALINSWKYNLDNRTFPQYC